MTDNRFQIAHRTIYSRKIKQSCKIVQISDLHNCCKGKLKKMIADAVKSAAPDFVVCTGDLFNRKNASDGSDTFELMQTIIAATSRTAKTAISKSISRFMGVPQFVNFSFYYTHHPKKKIDPFCGIFSLFLQKIKQ